MTKDQKSLGQQPSGFTRTSSGLSSEYAREQGWGLNRDERAHAAKEAQNFDGGRDYDYGARDFGDSPTKIAPAKPHSREAHPKAPAKRTTRGRS